VVYSASCRRTRCTIYSNIHKSMCMQYIYYIYCILSSLYTMAIVHHVLLQWLYSGHMNLHILTYVNAYIYTIYMYTYAMAIQRTYEFAYTYIRKCIYIYHIHVYIYMFGICTHIVCHLKCCCDEAGEQNAQRLQIQRIQKFSKFGLLLNRLCTISI